MVEVFLGWKNYRGEFVLFSVLLFVGSLIYLRQRSLSALLQTGGTLEHAY